MPILTIDNVDCDQVILNTIRQKCTCYKCNGILIQPQMCEACRLVYCLQCITNSRCPYCHIKKVNDAPKEISQYLYDLRLHCPNAECKRTGKYKFILKHIKTCGIDTVNRSFMAETKIIPKQSLIRILEKDSEKESEIILEMIRQLNDFVNSMKKEEPLFKSLESKVIELASIATSIDEKLK